jgi:hypothetical protein
VDKPEAAGVDVLVLSASNTGREGVTRVFLPIIANTTKGIQ